MGEHLNSREADAEYVRRAGDAGRVGYRVLAEFFAYTERQRRLSSMRSSYRRRSR